MQDLSLRNLNCIAARPRERRAAGRESLTRLTHNTTSSLYLGITDTYMLSRCICREEFGQARRGVPVLLIAIIFKGVQLQGHS